MGCLKAVIHEKGADAYVQPALFCTLQAGCDTMLQA